jgi:hypothetical protein
MSPNARGSPEPQQVVDGGGRHLAWMGPAPQIEALPPSPPITASAAALPETTAFSMQGKSSSERIQSPARYNPGTATRFPGLKRKDPGSPFQ